MSQGHLPQSLDPLELQIRNAKAFLLQTDTSGVSVYEHLSTLLSRILSERPPHALESLRELSTEIQWSRLEQGPDVLRTQREDPHTYIKADMQRALFSHGTGEGQETEGDADIGDSPLPNLLDLSQLLQQAGVSLGRDEVVKICLALKRLVDTHPLQYCRLWGKMLGTEGSYLVAEVQFREGEDDEAEERGEEEENEVEVPEHEDEEETEEAEDLPPKSTYRPPPVIPMEEYGKGANKYVYYVCSEAGTEWVRLPQVTPAQICAARKIKRFFTGHLDAPVLTYPPFAGTEANLLRAQISRISAGTHISPLGFYQFGEEEGDEEEEEGAVRDTYEENPEFEGIPVPELVESLSNWVHHVQHILPQGRCVWFNTFTKSEEEAEEEEGEEEEKEEEEEPEPEVGPPLLTPLSEDSDIDQTPPWTASLSSRLIPQYALAVLRSNLWPGAYAVASSKKFENIYIGWGVKYSPDGFSPAAPPAPQPEYPSGPEISEASDPTVEEEQALKAAQEEAAAAAEEMEEEEEEEEEEDD